MAKQLMYGEDARKQIRNGVKKLADAVRVTMGPTGKNVLMEKKFGSPDVTKDGVTVAKEVELENPFENVGAKLAQAVSEKTNDVVGDGTTTAVVLVDALYSEGLRNVAAGADTAALKRGIDKAVQIAVEDIRKISRPVKGIDDYRRVATISAHGEKEIGDMVAQAMDRVGKDGVITVEEGKGRETTVEYVDGMQFDKGYISPYFITSPTSLAAELEDAFILLTDKKLSNIMEVVPLLEQVAQSGSRLLVVCEDMEGQVLSLMVLNRLRGLLHCCAVKAPAFGDRRKAILEDIAVLTGGKVISDDLGIKLEKVKLADLGRAKNVKIEKEKTTIVGGAGTKKAIEARIAEIRALIKKTTSDYDREKLEERLSRLLGGVAIVKVGGATESVIKERKYRVDDAVHAVKAAAQEGIIPGGGTAYVRASKRIAGAAQDLAGDERTGAMIVARALEAPMACIVANTGADPSAVMAEVKEASGWSGYNAATGEFADMMDAGVLDATKVAVTALQNAASVASLMLTANTVITEIKEKKEGKGKKEAVPVEGAVV
ncbi:MAG: chaperonin GroL [Planctomycetes bacterium RBG_16_59_8]|nr:MAG: chaperonin GroL [Planctomycetes bacterium RBG_16_59_8]